MIMSIFLDHYLILMKSLLCLKTLQAHLLPLENQETPTEVDTEEEFHDTLNDPTLINNAEIQGENLTNLEETIAVEEIAQSRIQKNHPVDNIIGDIHVGVQTRNQKNVEEEEEAMYVQLQDEGSSLHSCFISQIEPKNANEALTDSDWIMAMQEELTQFEKLGVWTLVECPERVKPISTKWVFKCKKDDKGVIVRNKARSNSNVLSLCVLQEDQSLST